MVKCGACCFFDCGRDCRCFCHDHDKKPRYETRKPTESEIKRGARRQGSLREWDAKSSEEASMEGLSSLFG